MKELRRNNNRSSEMNGALTFLCICLVLVSFLILIGIIVMW